MAWKREMASGPVEASLFRELTDKEEDEFRAHAQKEFAKDPDIEINELWHPVIRQELKALKRGL